MLLTSKNFATIVSLDPPMVSIHHTHFTHIKTMQTALTNLLIGHSSSSKDSTHALSLTVSSSQQSLFFINQHTSSDTDHLSSTLTATATQSCFDKLVKSDPSIEPSSVSIPISHLLSLHPSERSVYETETVQAKPSRKPFIHSTTSEADSCFSDTSLDPSPSVRRKGHPKVTFKQKVISSLWDATMDAAFNNPTDSIRITHPDLTDVDKLDGSTVYNKSSRLQGSVRFDPANDTKGLPYLISWSDDTTSRMSARTVKNSLFTVERRWRHFKNSVYDPLPNSSSNTLKVDPFAAPATVVAGQRLPRRRHEYRIATPLNDDIELEQPVTFTFHPDLLASMSPHIFSVSDEAMQGVVGLDKKIDVKRLSPEGLALLNKAKQKEWNSMRNFRVFEPITMAQIKEIKRQESQEHLKPMPLSWVFEWRIVDGVKNIKARLVAQGTERHDRRTDIQTAVGLPHHRALRTLITYQIQQPGWGPESMLQVDLATAFLQAPNPSPFVWVKLPPGYTHTDPDVKGMFSEDGLARAVQTLYGTRDAPANLDRAIRDRMRLFGYVEVNSCNNVYVRYTIKGVPYRVYRHLPDEIKASALVNSLLVLDSWVFAYVDDILAGGIETPTREIFAQLATVWKFKAPPATPARFLGLQQHLTENGVLWSQYALAQSLDVEIGDGKVLDQPLPKDITSVADQCDSGELCDPKKTTRFRSLLGSLSFLQHTRPDILFTISFLSRYSSNPTKPALDRLIMACRFVKKTARYGILFPTKACKERKMDNNHEWAVRSLAECDKDPPSEAGTPPSSPFQRKTFHFDIVADASFSDRSTAGYFVFLNGNIIAMRAYTQRRVFNSSTKSEAFALYDAIDVGKVMYSLLRELRVSRSDISATVWSDSNDVVKMVKEVNPKSVEPSTRLIINIIKRCLSSRLQRRVLPNPPSELSGVSDTENNSTVEPDTVFDTPEGSTSGFWADVPTSHTPPRPDLQHLTSEQQAKEIKGIASTVRSLTQTISSLDAPLWHLRGQNNPADALTKTNHTVPLTAVCVHDVDKFLNLPASWDNRSTTTPTDPPPEYVPDSIDMANRLAKELSEVTPQQDTAIIQAKSKIATFDFSIPQPSKPTSSDSTAGSSSQINTQSQQTSTDKSSKEGKPPMAAACVEGAFAIAQGPCNAVTTSSIPFSPSHISPQTSLPTSTSPTPPVCCVPSDSTPDHLLPLLLILNLPRQLLAFYPLLNLPTLLNPFDPLTFKRGRLDPSQRASMPNSTRSLMMNSPCSRNLRKKKRMVLCFVMSRLRDTSY